MRLPLLLLLLLLLLLSPSQLAMASTSPTAATAKIDAGLLASIRADTDHSLRADVMIQLQSPAQALEQACQDADAADRGQRATCVADALQRFADAAQDEVKALLARHEGEYERAQFLWINNSVSLKKATGALVVELAQLESVQTIRPEQIFHLQGGGQ